MTERRPSSGTPVRAGISAHWLLLSLLFWWVLADPRPGGWAVAALAALVGGILHRLLGGRTVPRIRIRGMIAFVPHFLLQSVRGGIDVSRRAMAPRLPIDPALVSFKFSMPPGPGRAFFTSVLSLLPGTLGARLNDDEVLVHVLSGAERVEENLRKLEGRVAAIFLPRGSGSGERRGASRAGDSE